MPSLSILVFKVTKYILASKSDVTKPAACSNFYLVVQFNKSNTTLTFSLIWLFGAG